MPRVDVSSVRTVTSDRKRAFTLIEMLVVVGIIAVLIAILLPVLGKMKERARRAQCTANLRQLHAAIASYAADNNGKLFHHRISYEYNKWLHLYGSALHQCQQWDERRNLQTSYKAFIPPDLRTTTLNCSYTDYPPIGWPNPPTIELIEKFNGYDSSKAFGNAREDMGGEGGFVESIFPRYMSSCKPLFCPSAKFYAYQDAPPGMYEGQTNAAGLEQALRAIAGGGARANNPYGVTPGYAGNIYGRMGNSSRPQRASKADLWPGYFLQGYYPYYFQEHLDDPFFEIMRKSLMWDVGTYVNKHGRRADSMPHDNEGNHDIGGHFLLRDGAVVWVEYPFRKQEWQD